MIGRQDRTLELNADTIDIPKGTTLHDITVQTNAQSKDFDPARISAEAGDYVRFTTDDSRTHAIVFEVADPEIRAFLETTRQLRSPPLVTKGASWVLTLKDAPAGNYSFRCMLHNDSGRLTVAGR